MVLLRALVLFTPVWSLSKASMFSDLPARIITSFSSRTVRPFGIMASPLLDMAAIRRSLMLSISMIFLLTKLVSLPMLNSTRDTFPPANSSE